MSKSNFFINASALIGSNILSQIIAILASVVEARLYTPTEMGVYSTYIAILAVLTVIVCFQYERAIILTQDDDESNNLMSLCFLITTVLVIIAFFITELFSKEIAVWLNVLQLSLFVAGIIAVMTYWNIKNSNMKLIALVNVVTVLVMNFCQIIFGLERFHLVGGMIAGHLIGNAVAALLYFKESNVNLLQKCYQKLKILRRFKDFPLYSVPSTFLDTLGANLPNLLLANFFGAAIVGYYSFGYRVLSVPVSVITNAMGQAFLPKAVEALHNNTLDSATRSIFEYILKIALIPLLLVSIVAKDVIFIVFGDIWLPAAEFIPWLCFWLFWGLLYSPISGILIVLEKQRDALVINVIRFCIKAISLFLGGILGSPLLAIAACSLTSGIASLAASFYIMHLVKTDFWDIIKLIVKYVIKTLLFVCPAIIAVVLLDNPFAKLSVGFLNGLLFLAVFGKEVLPLLRRK